MSNIMSPACVSEAFEQKDGIWLVPIALGEKGSRGGKTN